LSKENVEIVKRFESLMVPSLEEEDPAVAEKRLQEILDLLDPNVAFHATPSLPHGGDYVGHDSFMKMGEQFRELWNTPGGVDLQYFDIGGDKVLTMASFIFESVHTGRSVPNRMVEIVTVQDGKITDLVAYYFDTVPIVEAGGDKKGRYWPGSARP
jgi:ketosteroid isomerase-like protein